MYTVQTISRKDPALWWEILTYYTPNFPHRRGEDIVASAWRHAGTELEGSLFKSLIGEEN